MLVCYNTDILNEILVKVFQKKIEDFVCEHCAFPVSGDGYTNHCPRCLYGKHVDVHPGDRAETCQGLMEPIGYERVDGRERLIHRCLTCGLVRKNRVQEGDDFEAVLAVAKKQSKTI